MNNISLTIGSYTDYPSESQGLYQVNLNTTTGILSKLELLSSCQNPSFVVSSQSGYYVISEVAQNAHPRLSFINNKSSSSPTNSAPIVGDHPCHIAIDPNNKYIVTSQYSSGSFDIFALNIDGTIDQRMATISPKGSGPHADRQTRPHAHQCVFLKSTPQYATVDLGSDRVNFYCFDEEQNQFLSEPAQSIMTPPGSGPRHIVFSQDETAAYVVCELSETILVLRKTLGQWGITQEIDALPKEKKGEAAAAIKLSPDGRFLYVSCRAQSKISCFEVSKENQQLTFKDSFSTQGKFPRDFYISDDGEWVVAANQHSNSLVSFKRNNKNGALTYTGSLVTIGSPVCVTN
ncbi:lactonase family protein [Vibrio makurazakiensis]|uniref:lactonase family protein n=1 Tax=Vibrio makurazakiensis TaxID=2910250 RepID=UPI003D15176C